MIVNWKLIPQLQSTLLSKLYNNSIYIKVAFGAYEG